MDKKIISKEFTNPHINKIHLTDKQAYPLQKNKEEKNKSHINFGNMLIC